MIVLESVPAKFLLKKCYTVFPSNKGDDIKSKNCNPFMNSFWGAYDPSGYFIWAQLTWPNPLLP